MHLKNHKEVMVSIYGGETMANKKVLKKGIEQFGNFYEGIKLNWVVNTNGSLLKEEDALFFKKHNVEIHISIDGREEIHNISRPTHKGKGTFQMVLPALEQIKKYKVPAQINSYMMPSNYLHLRDIVDIAEKYEISKIYLDQFYNMDMFTHKVGVDIYREVYYYAMEKKINVTGPWSKVIKNHDLGFCRRELLKEVYAMDVNIDGSLYFPYVGESKRERREIKDLYELACNNLFEEIGKRAQALYDKKCEGCSLKNYCFGSAIEQVHYHMGLSANTEISCNFFRDWCNYLLRPVHLKRVEKLQIISLIPLTEMTSVTEGILNEINKMEKELWPLQKEIFLNIVDDFETLRASSRQYNLPSWAVATTDGENFFYHRGSQLTLNLRHELCHLFIAQKKLKLPKWFIEGVCEWIQNPQLETSFLKKAVEKNNILSAVKKNGQLVLIELDQEIPEKNALYIQAKGFVGYLRNQIKIENWLDFLKECEKRFLESDLEEFVFGLCK